MQTLHRIAATCCLARSLKLIAPLLLVGCDTRARTPSHAANGSEVAWSKPVAIAAAGGTRGPWRQNESVYDYVDDPAVVLDSQGIASIAWVDQAAKDVLFRRVDIGGMRSGEVVNVSKSPDTFSWVPRVAMTGTDGQAIAALWQEIVFSGGSHGGEIFFARSTDGGRSFSPPRNLSNSVEGDGKGRLTRDHWDNGSLDLWAGASELYATWTQYEGGLWFSRSGDAGQSFGIPVRVAGTPERPARAPSIATGPDGRVHLAWTVGEDPGADIHWATSTDQGRSFSTPQVAWKTAGHSDAPDLTVDHAGTIHLVFGESPRGPGGEYQVQYTFALKEEDSFRAPRAIAADIGSHFPSIGAGANASLCVLWERYPQPGKHARGLGFSLSLDGGRSFSSPASIPGTEGAQEESNGGRQGMLLRKLSCDDSGIVAVVHSTFRENVESRVFLVTGTWRRGG